MLTAFCPGSREAGLSFYVIARLSQGVPLREFFGKPAGGLLFQFGRVRPVVWLPLVIFDRPWLKGSRALFVIARHCQGVHLREFVEEPAGGLLAK